MGTSMTIYPLMTTLMWLHHFGASAVVFGLLYWIDHPTTPIPLAHANVCGLALEFGSWGYNFAVAYDVPALYWAAMHLSHILPLYFSFPYFVPYMGVSNNLAEVSDASAFQWAFLLFNVCLYFYLA